MSKSMVGLAGVLLVASAGDGVYAQLNARAAPGVVAPNSPRILRDGEVEPAPADRSNGGVGAQEVPSDTPQTRSGGPVGGNKSQQE